MNTDKRIRLLLIIDSLTGGGAERIISQIANYLDSNKYNVQIVLTLSSECVQHIEKDVIIVKLIENIDKRQFSKTRIFFDKVISFILYFHYKFNKLDSNINNYNYIELLKFITDFRVMSNTLRAYINDWNPDCIISFLPNSNMLTLLSQKRSPLKIPVFLSGQHLHVSIKIF